MIASREPRLVLLFGLGGDERLFDAQRAAFPDLLTPKYPELEPSDGFRSIAEKIAQTLPRDRPLVVGGSSFGGAVACELAAVVDARAIVLIGSARSTEGIPWLARWLGPTARLAPIAAFSALQSLAPTLSGLFGARTPDQARVFVDMLRSTSPVFLARACRIGSRWTPTLPEGVPVHAIHGADDRILPARLAEADVVVSGAGHLISMSHPQEVNDFLRGILRASM